MPRGQLFTPYNQLIALIPFRVDKDGRMGAFSTYPAQISQIRDGKSTLSQPALIVSDPVQISQIRHGKSPSASQP